MKRLPYLLISFLLILSFSGCGSNSQQTSPPPAESPPPTTWEMPTDASPPDTMTVDEILYVVNEHLGYEDESDKILSKEDAEAFDVPASDEEEETLYFFNVGDLEIVLFASKEKDCVVGAYVRALFEDDQVVTQMMSFAGVLLAALEPGEYETMLTEAFPAGEEEKDITKTSSGEAWSIMYNRWLININPIQDEA